MESKFVNRENLTMLNNQVSRELNLQDKSKIEKKEVLNLLLNNMKKVYNKLDKNKITDKHMPKIMDTFNRYSIQQTLHDYQNKQPVINKDINVGPMQYNRDREVNKDRNVHYMERPQQTYQNRESGFDLSSRNLNYNGKPNVGNVNFDNSSRYNEKVAPEKAMEQLLSERQTQVPSIDRPSTPEFLKTSQVGERNAPIVENFNQNTSFSSTAEAKLEDTNKMQNDTYYLSGANVDSNFSGINFSSNEISKGLPEIDESVDTNQRLEMLQQERSTIGNVNGNTNETIKIDKPDFTKSVKENEEMQMKQKELQEQQRQYQMKQQHIEDQMRQQQEMEKQMYEQQVRNQQQQNNMMNASNISNGNIVDKLGNINNNDILKLLNTYANSNSSMNRQPNPEQHVSQVQQRQVPQVQQHQVQQVSSRQEDKINEYLSDLSRKQMDQLKQVQQLQEQLQNHLKGQMLNPNQNISNQQMNYVNNPKSQNIDVGENDELNNELISKVKILTGQLEQEKKINTNLRIRLDELMEEQTNENDRKIKLIDDKKDEIKKEVISLSNRHKTVEESYNNLLKKEKFINGIIQKNLSLIKADKKTIFINSKYYNSVTKFNHVLEEPIDNVNKIELITYDFPLISNNINETNNKLYFKFNEIVNEKSNKSNDEEKDESDSEEVAIDDSDDINIMTIPNGNYDISTLVKKLNKLGKTYDLTFSYNKNTSKVTIKSDNMFNMYRKESNILGVLGYDDTNMIINNNTYVGANAFDLRKNNYIYLYIKNVSKDEFAVVNTISPNKGSYMLDVNSVNLNCLDIEVKDEGGNLVDFCNLSFKLEFNIIFTNDEIKIDDGNVDEKLVDSDFDDEVSDINSLHQLNY